MGVRTTSIGQIVEAGRSKDGLVAVSTASPNVDDGGSDKSRSWERFYHDVISLSARICKGGMGDRWLIAEGDAYALAIGLFGVLHAGKTPVLPSSLQPGHLRSLVKGVDGVLASAALRGMADKMVPLFETVDSGVDEDFDLASLDESEVALYTSGSTGQPMEIRKPLHCLDAEIVALEATFGTRLLSLPDGLVHATVPAYHIYGLLFRVLWPLASGRPIAAWQTSYPEELGGRSSTHFPASILVASPAFLKRSQSVLKFASFRKHGVQIFSSGGPLPEEMAAQYNSELDYPIIEVYGSTETGGIGYRSVLGTDDVCPWTTLPGVKVSIDPEKNVLVVKSPFIPTVKPFQTGDIALLLDDSQFILRGRADNIVKLEDLRVSLVEIEFKLNALSEVQNARVFPLEATGNNRQSLAAVIQPSDEGWSLLLEHGKLAVTCRLKAALKPFYNPVTLPRKWRFVQEIPENDHGKTTQEALSLLFSNNQGRKTAPIVLDQRVEVATATLRLRLPQDLSFFDGHFDAESVLPGVVQVDWAVRWALNFFTIAAPVERVEALKFFKVLFAEQNVTLELGYDDERRRVSFRYFDGNTNYSKGRVIFGAPA